MLLIWERLRKIQAAMRVLSYADPRLVKPLLDSPSHSDPHNLCSGKEASYLWVYISSTLKDHTEKRHLGFRTAESTGWHRLGDSKN